MIKHTFHEDNERLSNLCGPLDENLRQVAQALDVHIMRRGAAFTINGERDAAQRALQVLRKFFERADQPVALDDIQLELVGSRAQLKLVRNELNATAAAQPGSGEPSSADIQLRTKRHDLQGRTANQVQYLRNIMGHDISFGIGPAGTGKTFLAVACAVDALEREAVRRLVLTRPAVEAGERLGFLPGDLTQKVDPYLRPLYDALYDLMGFEKTQRLFERGTIEIAPLAFMRGRTLNHAFVILDEAQNTTPEQMKMFLTRIGFGSKAVVTGDTSQVDLPKHITSGLLDAQRTLSQVRGIAMTQFTSADVVRHPLVQRIVEAYEAAAHKGKPNPHGHSD